MNEELMSELLSCINAVRPIPPGTTVGTDTRLLEGLQLESIQLIELQLQLETVLQVTFDPILDDFYEIFQTVGSLYDALAKKLEKTHG